MSPSEKLEDKSSWYRDRAKWIYDDFKKGMPIYDIMLKYNLGKERLRIYANMYEDYRKRQRKYRRSLKMRSKSM